MTTIERKQYRDMRERAEALHSRLEEGDPGEPVTREEALEILELVTGTLERMSPDRWDHMMEVVAEEAARRAGSRAAGRPG